MRITSTCGKRLSLFDQLCDALLGSAAATRCGLADFKRHRPRDPRDFTGAQRQQEVQALKIGAANQINYAQAGRDGPANIDAQKIRLRNHLRRPFGEAKPAQLDQ